MGVVIKQSFWGTFIAYFGVVISYANTLYLRPQFFSLDEIGLFTLVTANAMMISPLCTIGMNGAYIKYFPLFKDSKKLSSQFFTFQFSLVVIANIVILSIAFLNKDWIIGMFSKGASAYVNYLTITAIIVVVNSLFDQLYVYSAVRLKVIFPAFLREVFLRIGAILLVLGYAGGYFEFEWAIKGLAINYTLILMLLFGHLLISQKLRFNFSFSLIDKEWRGKIFSFALYSMAMSVTFAILNNVSYNQVSSILGDSYNGILVTCFFIGVIVEMPKRNMAQVVSPILSSTMAKGDLKETESLYKKSSITMSVIGFLLFTGIMTNLDDLFSFIPQGKEFSKGFGVVLAVCSAKAVLMLSSFAGEIINYSRYYKYNLVFQILAAAFLVTFNYLLIPIFGLNGVAISYFTTTLLHSVAKYMFVRYHFRIHPFMRSHLRLFVISLPILVGFYFFDTSLNPFFTIIIRSLLTTLVFAFLVYRFKISDDINRLVDSIIDRFKAPN